MRFAEWSVHPGLVGHSRVSVLSQSGLRSDTISLLVLVAAGVTAALATVLLDFRLRIPGHAILRAVFPMALGLALAPRRMGGTVMGASALGATFVLTAAGATVGSGALVSLGVLGPCLDAVLWRVRGGWRLYLGFALAGLVTNLTALTARAATKFGGLDHAGARPMAAWRSQAVGTYLICGTLAGLVSAVVWFRWASNRKHESRGELPR